MSVSLNITSDKTPRSIIRPVRSLRAWFELYHNNLSIREKNLADGSWVRSTPMNYAADYTVFGDYHNMDTGVSDAESFTIIVAACLSPIPSDLGTQHTRFLFNYVDQSAGMSVSFRPIGMASATRDQISFLFDGRTSVIPTFQWPLGTPSILGNMRLMSITRSGSTMNFVDHTYGLTGSNTSLQPTVVTGPSIIIGESTIQVQETPSHVSFYAMYHSVLSGLELSNEVSFVRNKLAQAGITV